VVRGLGLTRRAAPGTSTSGVVKVAAQPAAGRQRSSPLLIAYIGALSLAAVAIGAAVVRSGVDPPGQPSWRVLPLLVALLAGAEYFFVRFRYRGEVNALNLVEAVLAPLLFAFPGGAVVGSVVAAQVAGSILRRNNSVKSAFNVAQWSIAAGAGSIVLAGLADHAGVTGRTVAALLAALVGVGLVNQVAFTLVVAIASRQPLRRLLTGFAPIVVPGWLAGWAVNTLVGFLFVLAYATHPLAVLLFPVPLVVLHLAYRGYAGARSDRVRLTGLHRAARALAAPLDPTEAIEAYLREVAICFEARATALVLLVEGGRRIHRVDMATGTYSDVFEPDATLSLESAALRQRVPRRVTAGGGDVVAAALVAAGWRDCLSAPVLDEDHVAGVLLVLDQAGLEGFEAGELAVLEALARETAGTFAKGRLLGAILDERRKLAEIVGSTSDGILTLADDGIVRSWNPALECITGVPAGDLIGRAGGLAALHPRTSSGTPVDLEGWYRNVELPSEFDITAANGERRRLSCSYSHATDDDGRARTLVIVARDVTPVHEIEELRRRFGRLAEAEAAQRAVVEQLQQAFTPARPDVREIDLGVSYLGSDPSAPTGGDLYDWQLLPSGELYLAVVDVLGHGVAATKDALGVIYTLRLLTLAGCPLEDLVARADALLGAQHPELVATVVVVRYSTETGVARIAAGGHPPALLISPAGGVRLLPTAGCAVGWPGAGSEGVTEIELGPHDALVLYTDGLIEAKKDILEGMEWLVRHAREVAHLPADQLAAGLVERSLAGAERRDDSLALVLRRTPATVEPGRWRGRPHPSQVGEIRRALAGWLLEHDVAGEDVEDVLVAASELLANAVAAARTNIGLRAAVAAGRVAVEVEDDGPGHEDPDELGTAAPAPGAEAGRGLFLVRALMDEISFLSTSEGTVVRCEKLLRPVEVDLQPKPGATLP
jgi:PAS domain S-box-containing protein